MAEESQRPNIAELEVQVRVPGTDRVRVVRDIELRADASGQLLADIYYPPDARPGVAAPVVVIVSGYPDPGVRRILGRSHRDIGSTVSWARLIAASGMAAVAYANVDPEPDVHVVLDHIRDQAGQLGVDAERLGIWASSGNVPLALSLITRGGRPEIRAAALCYPVTLDSEGNSGVAELAAMFKFANAAAGRSVADLRDDVPMLLVRAGRDEVPGLNDALDRFLAAALAHSLPITIANHPTGRHAFDLYDDGPMTRALVNQVLAFLHAHLSE